MAITHVQRMRVQWVDTDGSGLIHYTAALRYFEVAEHALVRQLFEGRASESFMLPHERVLGHLEVAQRGGVMDEPAAVSVDPLHAHALHVSDRHAGTA